jgi:hypothetical protein
MRGNWKRQVIWLAVFAAGILQVSDLYAVWPFRRRANYGNYNNGYTSGTNYGSNYRNYGAAPMYSAPPAGAAVSAPGVGVNAGPAGAAVVAPGVGVNAGPGGAAVRAPGVGVNAGPAGANVAAPGARVNAGANANVGAGVNANAPGAGISVRGQSPEGSPAP